ncbi:uncharacterized protein K444DRAFT_611233 [Hyaloscypha bicolor E]|uniref:Peptidase S54 rhomboid domain-containing protein n=1 Tax=Hyaloscypha bicolor E TaxID=1095630 RepID=A0A2J6TG80_9HELO|nr:uncharacterized protein K444DRAFT_611233 [Hyaloscypha bicolor E]PMD62022.1 hypothetical protein K444DRAFT_611233 [Hyaloscypha bicolor E]
MLSTGFADAPVSRSLAYGIVAASILASVTDVKHYFYIQVDPHLWRYHQLWRIFTYQLCYTNSTEVLFATMTIYNMRVIERLWGSRKYASFVILSFCFTTLLPPMLLALILRPLSLNNFNYIPAGCTPLIFAILAQYHAAIPHVYKYRIAASPSPPANEPFVGLTFSDKSYVYLPAAQLALSQFPGSLLCAVAGWVVGYSWRNEVLPAAAIRWRIPGWMVGIRPRKRGEDFEGLRRRLEGENTNAAMATGSDGRLGGEVGRRRTLGRQLLDQFRGAF